MSEKQKKKRRNKRKFEKLHLISVTSDFNNKYYLFNGQVFLLTVHITKITEP